LKSQGKRNDLTSDQNEHKLDKSDAIAGEHGVSRATVVRAGAAAQAIDKQGVPELKEIVQSGSISMNEAATIAIFDDEKQIAIVAEINAGERILV
jgi:DNA-binding MurR/RpiR family transcriptional regulator